MERYQNNGRQHQSIGVVTMTAIGLNDLDAMPYSLDKQDQHFEGVEADKGQEVLVITIAQAVVDEGAMMIEKLDTPVADGAVEASLTLDDLAVTAEIFEVEADLECHLDHLGKVVVWAQIARLRVDCEDEEGCANEQKQE